MKCVVWDLDDTVWSGILAEGGGAELRPRLAEILTALDERGVLHSIASKNEPQRAMARLRELGVADYFLYPQISWQPKSELVQAIAKALNIGLDTLLFVDDSPFERAEVAHVCPQVRCVDAADLHELLALPGLAAAVTPESRNRRLMYRQEETRRAYEETFEGPRNDFLATLGMRLTIAPATVDDLLRAAELSQRTHQLNTTGLTFSADELAALLPRADQALLTMSLEDRFGSYGTIGIVLLGLDDNEWRIRLFLMSCRVMGRNIGGAVLAYLAQQASTHGRILTADFLPNDVNRPMYMVYRLAGFVETGDGGSGELVRRLRLRPGAGPAVPPYVELTAAALASL
ncbi:HAD-IIIC family phosphatase [Dactylosporangium sp. NBC_01737]|uniref:HAD-IIIC family phosphatase n=1 Tax=Dactylosporangium sp. NBC_01737 TaxID=2975959 RepID=UPI002E0E19BD|nr:HAD-IIIC family phosphatase [Dactylosporangium sp. NBC_01737]